MSARMWGDSKESDVSLTQEILVEALDGSLY